MRCGEKVQCFYCSWIRVLDRPEPIVLKYLFKPTNYFFCLNPKHKEKRRNQYSVYSRRNCRDFQQRKGEIQVEAPSTPIFSKCMFCGFVYGKLDQVEPHRESCEGWIEYKKKSQQQRALSKKRRDDINEINNLTSYLNEITEDSNKEPPIVDYHRNNHYNRWVDDFIDEFALELKNSLQLDDNSFLAKKKRAYLENHTNYKRIIRNFHIFYKYLRKQDQINDHWNGVYFTTHRLRCQMFGWILLLKPMVDEEKLKVIQCESDE